MADTDFCILRRSASFHNYVAKLTKNIETSQLFRDFLKKCVIILQPTGKKIAVQTRTDAATRIHACFAEVSVTFNKSTV